MIELATTRMSLQVQVIPASPSQRLTFDVLWHIFGYVCLSDPLKGPMSVSQVSHRWRLVALNSPFIWCNITIRLYTSSQQHLLASAYFKRSQNVPITLTIHATRHFKSWEKMELLQPHARRFRSLHVKASAGSLANLLWMEMDMPMPRLETFDTVISNTSRISINRKIVAIDENVNIIPPVCLLNLVHWDLWNPTGLTALTLDTTHLWNKPDLDDIYHALATTRHTLQHFKYQGLVACIDNAEVNTRTRLVFPALRSLAVLCHDDMVPLLELMIIPALDSLSLRDFIVYPAISTIPITEPIDIDQLTLTFDPDGLFQVIKQWTTITHLEIFGIDDLPDLPFDDLSPPPELLSYIKSLSRLSSLVLYGIGAATSIAYTLFMHDPTEEPLLPKLSCFLLAIVEMSPYDDLSHYLITRQRHQLSRLQKLSINLGYVRHISNLNRGIDILCDCSDEIFVFADPEVGKYIPIEEVKLLERSRLSSN
jgi:hypothetical protein